MRFAVGSEEKRDELVELMNEFDAESTEDGRLSQHEIPVDSTERFEAFLRRLASALKDEPGALQQLAHGLSRPRPSRGDIVRSSLLVTAVSAFETLIAGLATQHYRLFPSALGTAEKEFSLEDLKALGTIEDARHVAIARKVEALLFGSLEDWIKWFNRRLSIDTQALATDWPTLFEAVQRRHVIVHSNGHVSRLYLLRMEPYGGSNPEVGDKLPVSTEYLDAALNQLRVLGTRLVAIAWSKWDPHAGDGPAKQLSDLAYDALIQSNWAVAKALSASAIELAALDVTRQLATCNSMIAQKYEVDVEAIREQVASWDVSALSPEFRAAKAALLDDHDLVADLLPKLVGSGIIDSSSVRQWPLLRTFRTTSQYEKVLSELDELDASAGESTRESSRAKKEPRPDISADDGASASDDSRGSSEGPAEAGPRPVSADDGPSAFDGSGGSSEGAAKFDADPSGGSVDDDGTDEA